MSETQAKSPKKIKRIGITTRENHQGAQDAAERAKEAFRALGGEAYALEEVLDGAREVDCLLALGGDGTLLHAARLMAHHDVPVMGVNFGRVGYLCTISAQQLERALELLVEGHYTTDERSMIRASVFNRCAQRGPDRGEQPDSDSGSGDQRGAYRRGRRRRHYRRYSDRLDCLRDVLRRAGRSA